MPETTNDDSTDIVLRDRSGKYQVQMPVLPALEEDQAPGEIEGEGGKNSESSHLEPFPGNDDSRMWPSSRAHDV